MALLEREGVCDAAGRATAKCPTGWTLATPALLEGRLIGRVHVTFDENGDVVEYTLAKSNDAAELNHLWKCMMLAPTAAILDALLAGEAVPLDKLDQEWVRKLGRRAA